MADNKEAGSASDASKPQEKPDPGVSVRDVDDFGLPVKRLVVTESSPTHDGVDNAQTEADSSAKPAADESQDKTPAPKHDAEVQKSDGLEERSTNANDDGAPGTAVTVSDAPHTKLGSKGKDESDNGKPMASESATKQDEVPTKPAPPKASLEKADLNADPPGQDAKGSAVEQPEKKSVHFDEIHAANKASGSTAVDGGASGFSHQQLSTEKEADGNEGDDGGWQEMPSYAKYDIYDDDNRLVAREYNEEEIEKYGYGGLGGAGKGYTRVLHDDDADSTNSMDENTQYLFKEATGTSMVDDEDARDAMSQMQATKDLLTEGQRIAYVGVVRLEIANMVKETDALEVMHRTKKETKTAAEAMRMWGQKMMIRLYSHMDISEAEQIMIEQLAEHGVIPEDLTPTLHANSRVRNPMAAEETAKSSMDKSTPSTPGTPAEAPPPYKRDEDIAPPYEEQDNESVPEVHTPSQLPNTAKIDIDLRWTVLCDLFLILIADSIYDARSRILLERVGKSLDISWIDICKFEKRVTDALEMQQAAEKENWNEEQHLENRRKEAQTKRYVMMGLATVGGGLVIGLSGGLMAPLIGSGLAVGLTAVGIGGTTSFLSGVGGVALIASGAATTGGIIGGKAANRRTGSVQTFEYRPLHNNKRVNLIVTVSGWLTGKVDDVRLPFSTVDPIMGDIYSVLWEPEMLRSMGDTINILATEVRTSNPSFVILTAPVC